MIRKMSIFGVGPLITLLTFLFVMVVGAATWARPTWFMISGVPYVYLAVAGGVLVAATLVLHVISLHTLVGAYREGRLVTTGVYAVCRNPLYAWWILLGLPGIALLLGSWLFFAVPVFTYVVTRIAVRREEEYLEATFGQQYLDYRNRVNAIFPTLWK